MRYTRHCYLLSLLFVLNSIPANAQFGFKQNAKPAARGSLWLLHNPLTWLEPEIPVAVSFAYKTSDRLSYELDAAVYFARQDYDGDLQATMQPYAGVRFRPSVKFFPNGDAKGNVYGPSGFYFALQGLIKHTSRSKQEWFNIPSQQGAFQQLANYREKKNVFGLNFLFGSEILLDHRERFVLDIYSGIGIRTKHFYATGLPAGISINYEKLPGNFNIYRNGFYYSMSLGFKFGIRLF